jgi:UDP-hydrolysing UDP-N-acetyl-D-glucosamine 2-epimerase
MAPDVVVVLGDRVEVLAAAVAAGVGGIRVAHLHGGDRGEGVADESMRHAVSKLAHIHLAASEGSRRRLIRMGEAAGAVFNVGSPAADGLDGVRAEAGGPEVMVAQHPIGGTDAEECRWMRETLRATRGFRRVVMCPNRDPGSEGIRRAIREAGVEAVEHVPRARFLSWLAGSGVLVGNSSAGLIEAAVLRRACVNIGPRQAGRERAGNVVDCEYGSRRVRAAMEEAMKKDLRRMHHPYGDGKTGERVARLLATIELAGIPIRKRNGY